MSLYNTADSIPLSYMRVKSGVLVTGLSVTVKVLNVLTGATLLSTTNLSEITSGVYSYKWQHTLTAFTECVAIYTVGTLNYAENFTVSEELDNQESSSGHIY